MRNIFKTGCFHSSGNNIIKGMARAGVRNYRVKDKNIVKKSHPIPPQIHPTSMSIAQTGIVISLLSFPTCSYSVNIGFLQFLTGIIVFFLAAYHEFIKKK